MLTIKLIIYSMLHLVMSDCQCLLVFITVIYIASSQLYSFLKITDQFLAMLSMFILVLRQTPSS